MNAVDLLHLGGARATPIVHQSEAAECGLACLAMIAGYHGFNTDMPSLRRRFNLSMRGTTLKGVMHIAEQLDLNPRPLRSDLDELGQVVLPAILHWDLSHFVVLTRIQSTLRGRRYHIHDPAKGARSLTEAEFSRHFTGVVLELAPSPAFRRRKERSDLRINQLWSRASGLWSSLGYVLVFSLILQLIALAMPFYLQLSVDTVFPSFDLELLGVLALGFAGLVLINTLTAWMRTLLLVSLSNSLSYQLISNLYRHLLRLPLPWFEKRHVGDIISRFGSTAPISTLLSQGLVAAVIDGLMAFLTLALMFIYSPLLAIVALIAWGLFTGLKLSMLRVLRARNVDALTAAAKENSSFIEAIRGISAIKSFGQEGNRQRVWQHLKADAVNAQIKLGRLSAAFDSGGQLILGLERVLFVYLAVSMAMAGNFSIGMIFAFQAYKQQFLDAATRLVEQSIQYRLLDVHLSRIADIALTPAERAYALRTEGSERLAGAIEICGLGFRYGDSEPEVLREVNLRIEPGEMIALIGPSGGGKTTLLKLMIGLFEPTGGSVLIDGQPLASLNNSYWRSQVGTVSQSDMLFAGTLAENIAFFDPEIDMKRVAEVAGLAGIHDEVMAMPMRFDTQVGDMGSVLSGGQKQRILIARALYPDPAILFIDEGTAHLDPKSENEVVAALAKLPVTRVISAHRPAAISAADRVFLVSNGQVTPMDGSAMAEARAGR
jgi:ATP-binding cassette subfamily B protein RaxB